MKKINVPALGPILRVTNDLVEARRLVVKEGMISKDELIKLGEFSGCTFYEEHNWNILVYLPEIFNPGVFVHEMTHIMSVIHLYIGEKECSNVYDELRAYAAQDIADQIAKYLYSL